MWHIFTDTGVRWPNAANIQYRNASGAWVNVFPYTPPPSSADRVGVADPNSPIGVNGKSGTSENRQWPAPSTWASNGVWNVVEFPAPVTTTAVRLLVYSAKNGTSSGAPGIGVGEWEVFGVADPLEAALSWVRSNVNLTGLVADVTLPTVYPSDNTITFNWSGSTSAALTNGGVVTRPAIGAGDASGTIQVTVAQGGTSKSETLTDLSSGSPATPKTSHSPTPMPGAVPVVALCFAP
jgi:hypothetical protein